jgi:hypothetical protein
MREAGRARRAHGHLAAALSKFERRGDLQLGTLQRVVEHLGGRINVHVQFPDGSTARVEVADQDQASGALAR